MYKDIVYNNEILSDFLVIKNVRESLVPEVMNNSISIKGHAGSLFVNQEFGDRMIEIDVEILADNKQERQRTRDKLNYLLFAGNKQGKLYIGDRFYVVTVDSISSVTNIINDAAFTISFIANDPISYGELVSVKTNNDLKLYNRGTYKTMPKIFFRAKAEKARITLVSDYSSEYDYVEVIRLNRGDKVELDFYNEKIYINDKDFSKNLDPSGDFFFIEHGEFSINSEGAENVRVEYRERWL